MKQVSSKIKMELAQYRELASFSQFGSDVDADTRARLDHGAVLMEIIKQGQYKPMPVEKQVVSIFAATNGFMKDINVSDVARFEEGLLEYMENYEQDILDEIKEQGKLSDELDERIRNAIIAFRKTLKSDFLLDSQKALRHEELAEEDAAIDAARAEAEKAL
jgi:F-type H+-transporting ATPase subunit alpha